MRLFCLFSRDVRVAVWFAFLFEFVFCEDLETPFQSGESENFTYPLIKIIANKLDIVLDGHVHAPDKRSYGGRVYICHLVQVKGNDGWFISQFINEQRVEKMHLVNIVFTYKLNVDDVFISVYVDSHNSPKIVIIPL